LSLRTRKSLDPTGSHELPAIADRETLPRDGDPEVVFCVD
jgi:hypothetical protein